jgi:hypothetical protein
VTDPLREIVPDGTRRHPYLIASLLGHANPGTTFEHYVHMLDWLLRIHLDQREDMCPSRADILCSPAACKTSDKTSTIGR